MNPREMLWNTKVLTSDYVKQYEEIPKDGVLAQSRDVSKIRISLGWQEEKERTDLNF